MTGADDYLIWIDLETTGLDPTRDSIMEIGCVVTDGDLHEIADTAPFSCVLRPTLQSYADMPELVRQMHTKNGLLDEVENGLSLRSAEAKLGAYLQAVLPTPTRLPLAGNNVGFDRSFMAAYMPGLSAELFHYRNIDVSTVKELARRWCPSIVESAPQKTGAHRALGDILDSIEELRHYRNAGMFSSRGRTEAHVARAPMPELADIKLPAVEVPLVQVPEIKYPAVAAASDNQTKAHPTCKVCAILSDLPPDQRKHVTAALANPQNRTSDIASEFHRRGADLSVESVRRHRKPGHKGVR